MVSWLSCTARPSRCVNDLVDAHDVGVLVVQVEQVDLVRQHAAVEAAFLDHRPRGSRWNRRRPTRRARSRRCFRRTRSRSGCRAASDAPSAACRRSPEARCLVMTTSPGCGLNSDLIW